MTTPVSEPGALLSPTVSRLKSRSLRAWTATQRETVRLRLATLHASWCADWGLASLPVDLGDPPPLMAHWHQAGARPESADSAILWALSGRPADDPAAAVCHGLEQTLFGPGAPTAAGAADIAPTLAKSAWDDWWRRVHALCGTTPMVPAGTTTPRLGYWSGTQVFTVSWGLSTLYLGIERALVEAMLKRQDRPHPGIDRSPARCVPLAEALAGHTLHVRMALDGVDLSVGQLQDLHIGDVIPLRHRLDQPIQVLGSDGRPVCVGWLGLAQGHMALELSRPPEANR